MECFIVMFGLESVFSGTNILKKEEKCCSADEFMKSRKKRQKYIRQCRKTTLKEMFVRIVQGNRTGRENEGEIVQKGAVMRHNAVKPRRRSSSSALLQSPPGRLALFLSPDEQNQA